jgi:hypothetical protein
MNRQWRSLMMLVLMLIGLVGLVGVAQQARAQDQTQSQDDDDQDTNDSSGAEQDEGETADDQDTGGEDDTNNDQEAYAPTIDPASFVAVIDNPYFPLVPGTVRIYEGQTDKGFEHIEVTVTSDTRQIMGVTCVVVKDIVTIDEKTEEETYDWYAQDKDGNVWYFGEDTKKYETDGTVSTEGSFEAGIDGAMPGILMKGNPQVGDAYREEFYQGHAEDEAEIVSIAEAATVPYGSYKDVLMTKNTTKLEPDLLENKYYAKGVGSVLEVDVAGGSGQVELIEVRTN